tara:strand:- start:776 stop:1042 length:267 start_codon:yes stop_codon:yes gene_type:complete
MSKIEVNQIEKTSTGSEITVLSPLTMDHPLKIKVYSTSQINALTASTGQLVFDSDQSSLKIYDGTQWAAVGAGGGSSDEAFAFSLIGD